MKLVLPGTVLIPLLASHAVAESKDHSNLRGLAVNRTCAPSVDPDIKVIAFQSIPAPEPAPEPVPVPVPVEPVPVPDSTCDIAVDAFCVQHDACFDVITGVDLEDCLCDDKLSATTLMYIGGDISESVTYTFTGKNEGDVLSVATFPEGLTYGTVVRVGDQNNYTIDTNGGRLDAQTNIYKDNTLQEIIHTSCSAVYYAGRRAPLDADSPNNPTGIKGEPSPNWWVVNFLEENGVLVKAFGQEVTFSTCNITSDQPFFYRYEVQNTGNSSAVVYSVVDSNDSNTNLLGNENMTLAGGENHNITGVSRAHHIAITATAYTVGDSNAICTATN